VVSGPSPLRLARRWALTLISPPDWVFVPVAAAATAGLVALALNLRPDVPEPVMDGDRFIMTGEALAQMIPGPGTHMELVAGPTEPLARLRATASFEAAGRLSAGVGVALPEAWEARVPGRTVRVEYDIQAPPGSTVTQARVAYYTVGHGDSPRALVEIGPTWQTVGTCYAVRASAVPNGQDIAGIWPDERGGGDPVLVRALRLFVEPEGTTVEACLDRIGGGDDA
jgi:hypothetical protein